MALAIGVGVDLLVMKGDIDRQNTVFKLYLQAWLFFSLAGSYALGHLGFVRGWFTPISPAPGPLDGGPHPACGRCRRVPGLGHRSAAR